MSGKGEGEPRERKPATKAPTERAQVSGSDRDQEDGFGVLDVIKAIAPLLVIIGLALSMLVLGYVFLPPNLSLSFFESTLPAQSPSSSAAPSPTKEANSPPEYPTGENIICEEIHDVKEVISALKDITEWRRLGSVLGISEEQLEAIDDRHDDPELKKRAMLRLWFEIHAHKKPFCWVRVIDALLALGHQTMAEKMAKKHEYAGK